GIAELLRPATPGPDIAAHRPASGREQHTHKITVYLSADELFELEHARLALRRYGITTDRGRLVREAIAVLLADLDARGETSVLALRIAAQPDQVGGQPGSAVVVDSGEDGAPVVPDSLSSREHVRGGRTGGM
ncbi:MAG: hypothetical protein QOJ73_2646, partial [Streptosporangiaceae bacterium]|nr:hypothetical protein [Streptosporangiaceae bacterium]